MFRSYMPLGAKRHQSTRQLHRSPRGISNRDTSITPFAAVGYDLQIVEIPPCQSLLVILAFTD